MRKRKYYPLKPPKGDGYRKPKNVIALYVNSDVHGSFLDAAYTSGDNHGTFEDPSELARFLGSLPNNCWILTYNIDHWSSLFNSLINNFSRISGIGNDNHVTELEEGEEGWTIVDIFQFLASSLPDAVYNILGIEAGYKTTSSAEWAAYIWLIWAEVVRVFEQFNCYPSKTPGASAMKIWMRFMPGPVFPAGKFIQKISRAAIKAAALHWTPGIYEDAYLYDLSASYPFVMRVLRFPTHQKIFTGHPPRTSRWIATVKINYKCAGEFSPLSVKLPDGTHIHPTEVKDFRTSMTYIDALTLELTGDLEIIEWIEGVSWDPKNEVDLFGTWSSAIEEASRDPISNKILKIVSRALHSKFAPRRYYEHIEIRRMSTPELQREIKKRGRVLEIYPLDDGGMAAKLKTRKRIDFKPFNRPDWEALILAAGRFRIYTCIDADTVYTNTDCIISTKPRDDLPIGSAFGLWREKDSGPAFVLGPGVYAIGQEVGKSGMKISDDKARFAIQQAAEGQSRILQTLCHPALFSPISAGSQKFTVQAMNYPKARVEGLRAWVTRSPTRLIRLNSNRRTFTFGGQRKCLKRLPRR